MLLALVIKPEELTFTYGDIPNIPSESSRAVEMLRFELPDSMAYEEFDEQFVQPVDECCHTLLDCGDVEFFNSDACRLLENWIPDRVREDGLTPWVRRLYVQLLSYASRAVDLGTGVVIEL